MAEPFLRVLDQKQELSIENISHLFVYKRNSADFFHDGFSRCPLVNEVGGDGDGQLAAKLLPLET